MTDHHVKPLTLERYNAFVAWTRSPIANAVGRELEFFSSHDESLLGVVVLDRTDRDYGFVTLGRDGKGRFRAIDVNVSMSRTDARHSLLQSIKRHVESGTKVFEQGDEHQDKAGVDLFSPVVKPEKMHPTFEHVATSDFFVPARAILSEMMRHYEDVDGNFVEQFQTTGFDTRTWELYLYAALLELGLFVERPTPAPDFKVMKGGRQVFIEAVTVNPTGKVELPKPTDPPKSFTTEELVKNLDSKFPIKFASPLWSKLNRDKPYWELEHVVGHPLIFAIADFQEKQSMMWTAPALFRYLYGVSHEMSFDENGNLVVSPLKAVETHTFEGKTIPSGFFRQAKSENVSAVLFSATGTMSKFNRMGMLAGFGHPGQRLRRVGVRHRHEEDAVLPEPYEFEVIQGSVTETWAEGLELFHNPNAARPVDPAMFPGIAHHFFEDGVVKSVLPDFHPYFSVTFNSIEGASDLG